MIHCCDRRALANRSVMACSVRDRDCSGNALLPLDRVWFADNARTRSVGKHRRRNGEMTNAWRNRCDSQNSACDTVRAPGQLQQPSRLSPLAVAGTRTPAGLQPVCEVVELLHVAVPCRRLPDGKRAELFVSKRAINGKLLVLR